MTSVPGSTSPYSTSSTSSSEPIYSSEPEQSYSPPSYVPSYESDPNFFSTQPATTYEEPGFFESVENYFSDGFNAVGDYFSQGVDYVQGLYQDGIDWLFSSETAVPTSTESTTADQLMCVDPSTRNMTPAYSLPGGSPQPGDPDFIGPIQLVGPELPYAESNRDLASDITAAFETNGDWRAINDYDRGIISYGRHQATVHSGSLANVIREYTANSNSETSHLLEGYLDRIDDKDETLRTDTEFKQLLKEAGTDPIMQDAQEKIFTEQYWNPTMVYAQEYGITSPLGQALLADTAVQGGLPILGPRTLGRFNGEPFTEKEFLAQFAVERQNRLYKLADIAEKDGKLSDAQALRNTAEGRAQEWRDLIEAGNFDLTGKLTFHDNTVYGYR